MDYVGRFENVQQSYDEICARVGIPGTDLRMKNPSIHRHYDEYYNAELARGVANYYSEDFRQFDYSPDLNAASN